MAHSAKPTVSAFSFTNVSTAVGLASGLIGLYQFFEQHGRSLAEQIWDALYTIGFVGPLSLIFASLLCWGMVAILSKLLPETDQGQAEHQWEKWLIWGALLIGLSLGICIGLPMAAKNLEILQMNPLERMKGGYTEPTSPMINRLLGIGTLLIAMYPLYGSRLEPKKMEAEEPAE